VGGAVGKEKGGESAGTQKTLYQFSGLFCFYLLFIVIASQMFRAECKRKTKASKYREQSKANICK